MPGLEKSLKGHDIGYLRIVAEHWGVELKAPDARTAREQLIPAMLEQDMIEEVVETLAEEAQEALSDLIQHDGRIRWTQFTPRYGEVREMGPGRRDRERPDRHPASPAEILWYRGLIGRAFFDTPDGPLEFAYLPEDLLPLLPILRTRQHEPFGRPASPAEQARVFRAGTRILDHAATLMAALRIGDPPPSATWQQEIEQALLVVPGGMDAAALQSLLTATGLLTPDGAPIPEAARAFLETGRGHALAQLARAWLDSDTFNELLLLPGLRAEGYWKNDPLRTRRAVLDFLSTVPKETWWSTNAFSAAVKARQPDFQRREFDSWYLRDQASGEYLRGFEHWDEVEGALIRFLLTGPLYWLGIVELCAPEPDSTAKTNSGLIPAGFCTTKWAPFLLKGEAPPDSLEDDDRLHVRSEGSIRMPRQAPRAVRYQVARFCDWEPPRPEEYRYRLTPSSLARAREQGLRAGQLIKLLAAHSDGIPSNLTKALMAWETRGEHARVERLSVLRLSSPETLEFLRRSRAARFLGDPLGPTAIAVKPGAEQKVLDALVEMGYLGEVVEDQELG